MLNPAHPQIFKRFPLRYYWSFHQSEWATDIMFKDSATLAQIYPALVLHGITAFGSKDVIRFLGRKVHGAFEGEIISDFKNRPEGIRIKHRAGVNSVKLYDKQGSVLRGETTINDPTAFKVFRTADPPKANRRRSAKVSRLLRMLRAHGLTKKVNATHRYTLSSHGRDIVTAVLATQRITLQQLHKAAA